MYVHLSLRLPQFSLVEIPTHTPDEVRVENSEFSSGLLQFKRRGVQTEKVGMGTKLQDELCPCSSIRYTSKFLNPVDDVF